MTELTPAVLSPWAGIAGVLGAFGLTLAVLRWAQLRRGLGAVATQKALHAAMSAVALSLPWLFDADWPLAVLAAVAVATVLAIRFIPALRQSVGHVLHDGAASIGDVSFPLAVWALYVLADGSAVLYSIPILLLGIASPVAGLVAERHDVARFDDDEDKSQEGAVAFLFVAFLCVHVPLLLFTPVGRAEALWIGAIVAVLATIVETVSWRGLNNLFVPLGAYAVLVRLLTFDATLLVGHAAVLVGLLGVVAVLRRETTVGGAGVFGVALVGYLVWALGGTAWLLSPALVFVLYARIWPAGREADGLPHDPRRRPHTTSNVFSVSSVGVMWLLAASAFGADLLFPYAVAWSVAFAFLGVDRMMAARPDWGVAGLTWRAAWRATLVGIGPVLLVMWLRVWAEQTTGAVAGTPAPAHPIALTAVAFGVGLVASAVGAAVLARWKGPIDHDSSPFAGRVYRAAIVAPLSALGLLIAWLA
ncbi:hypothetical protein [Rubrivirga sp. IMCC45206]|uniref:hypothetical protein n=1 Tax=Rubrivirga sp. IMCC45206 TaxID=3391614 RepID=UPI0039900293